MVNPYESTEASSDSEPDQSPSLTKGHAAYNVVTDTVTGVNLRWSDNRFQAIFVFVSMVLVAVVGAIAAVLNSTWDLPWWGGALIGSFLGLVIGVFGSGIALMFYRAARHLKGKHD